MTWVRVSEGFPEPESGNGWHREAKWARGVMHITHWVRNTGGQHFSAHIDDRLIVFGKFKTFDGAARHVADILESLREAK